MLATFKSVVDYLSSPTISFTILTVLTPLVFPPTDWFDKINRKLKINLLWTKTGCAIGMVLITLFFIIGVLDKNFSIILLKADNFPIVLWLFLIVLGTFFRGPNWNFYGPFEYWDSHKVVALSSVSLSEYFWVKIGNTIPAIQGS